jgi:hypothetical protein
MTINSYFYDSIEGDTRTYSAADFAKAFNIVFETGCLIRETQGGTFGFDIGGTNYTTIYSGIAVIEGHFVEVAENTTETLTVPAGTYSGQVVLRLDTSDTRTASVVVKMDRIPVKTTTLYELELHNVNVVDGIITATSDLRYQGGAVPNNHNQGIETITGLQTALNAKADNAAMTTALLEKAFSYETPRVEADPNGCSVVLGKFAGTGRPIRIFFTTAQPAASNQEHRVWIQIDYQV